MQAGEGVKHGDTEKRKKRTDLFGVMMCGRLWTVSPYPEVEGGVGTCLATRDACGTDAGRDLGRDGDGVVHALVIADGGGLGVGVGMVGGVGGGGGVGVVVGGEDGVGRGVLLLEPGRAGRSRVTTGGGWGGVDWEGIGRTVLCDVVHRTRCDTSAGAFQRQVVVGKTCQGYARAVSLQVLYLTRNPIVFCALSAGRLSSSLLQSGAKDPVQVPQIPSPDNQRVPSHLVIVTSLLSYLYRPSLLPRPRR